MKLFGRLTCNAAVAGGCKGHAVPIGSQRREPQQVHRLRGVLVIRETLYLREAIKLYDTRAAADQMYKYACMNQNAGLHEASILVTCMGTGMCKGVTFRRRAGADFGRYLLFARSSARCRLPSSSAEDFLETPFVSPGGASV